MELVMEAQENATPWPSPTNTEEDHSFLLGRGSFDKLGQVRRKPGKDSIIAYSWVSLKAPTARANSPVTFSKSCSDKLALKECTSLLSGVASLLIHPANAYIDTLIIPKCQYRAAACERAFGMPGRMNSLAGNEWLGGYSFLPFNVQTTDAEFLYSRNTSDVPRRQTTEAEEETTSKGSNITAVWSAQTPTTKSAGSIDVSQKRGPSVEERPETLIKGRLQGWKETDPRGASKISRREMWRAVAEVYSRLSIPTPAFTTYEQLKLSDILAERRTVKAAATAEALKGWMPNVMDSFDLTLP